MLERKVTPQQTQTTGRGGDGLQRVSKQIKRIEESTKTFITLENANISDACVRIKGFTEHDLNRAERLIRNELDRVQPQGSALPPAAASAAAPESQVVFNKTKMRDIEIANLADAEPAPSVSETKPEPSVVKKAAAPPSTISQHASSTAASRKRDALPCGICNRRNHAQADCYFRKGYCIDCYSAGHDRLSPACPKRIARAIATSNIHARDSGGGASNTSSRHASASSSHRPLRSPPPLPSESRRRDRSSSVRDDHHQQARRRRRRSRSRDRDYRRSTSSTSILPSSSSSSASHSTRYRPSEYNDAPATSSLETRRSSSSTHYPPSAAVGDQAATRTSYYPPPVVAATAAATVAAAATAVATVAAAATDVRSTPEVVVTGTQTSPSYVVGNLRADQVELQARVAELKTQITKRARVEQIAPLCALVNVMEIRDSGFIVSPAMLGLDNAIELPTVESVVTFLGLLDRDEAFAEANKRSNLANRTFEDVKFVRGAGDRVYPVPHEFVWQHPLLTLPFLCRLEPALASLDSKLEFSVHFDGIKLSSGPSSAQALLGALRNERFHLRQIATPGGSKEFRLESIERGDVIVISKAPVTASASSSNTRVVTKFLATRRNTPNVGDQITLFKSVQGWEKELPKGQVPLGLAFSPKFQSFSPFQFLADLLEAQALHCGLEGGISDELFGLGLARLWDLEATFRAPMLYRDAGAHQVASFQLLGIAQEEERVHAAIAKANELDAFRFFNIWGNAGDGRVFEKLDTTVWRDKGEEYQISYHSVRYLR